MYQMILENINKDIFNMYDSAIRKQIQKLLFDREYLYYYKLPTNNYVITLESNKIVGENSAKLCDICGLMNFGNLSYPAMGTFTKVFSYIENNFWKIYRNTIGAIF